MISVGSEVQILPGPPMLLKRGCSSAGRAPALQAGGRRFESDHLHHFGVGVDRASEHVRGKQYRGEAKIIGVCGFCRKRDAGGVSKWRHGFSDQVRGHGLCQGESGSGASLGASIAFLGSHSPGISLTECLRVFSDGVSVQRRLLCAEREVFLRWADVVL